MVFFLSYFFDLRKIFPYRESITSVTMKVFLNTHPWREHLEGRKLKLHQLPSGPHAFILKIQLQHFSLARFQV